MDALKIKPMLQVVSLPAPSEAPAARPLTVPLSPAEKSRKKGHSGKIALPTMEGLCFEKIKHLAFLEASGNYTVLHFTDARQVLVCKTLREVEQLLPETDFVRIHRSHTLHLRHIKKYVRGKGGHVVLQNGATLVVSSGQREVFLEAVKRYFN